MVTLNSDVTENVIRFADDENDGTTVLLSKIKKPTTDKVLVNGNTAVVTDATNEIKYQVMNYNKVQHLKEKNILLILK